MMKNKESALRVENAGLCIIGSWLGSASVVVGSKPNHGQFST